MAGSLPNDVQTIVADLLASGQYESEAAIMREAIGLLKQRDQLKHDVHEALAELDRGEGIEADAIFRELRQKAARLGIPDV